MNFVNNQIKKSKLGMKDTIGLLKNTFILIGKDTTIIKPTIKQIIWLVITTFAILASFVTGIIISSMNISENVALGVFSIGILLVFFMIFILPFIFIKLKMIQSWIVYKTLSGKGCSYAEAKKEANKNTGDVIWIGIIDTIVRGLVAQARNQRGVLGMIAHLIAGAIEESWDLIGNYLIPGAIIDQDTSVWQVAKDLKHIKENVPGALTGVFGFDLVGGALKTVIALFCVFIIVIGIVFLVLFKIIWFLIMAIALAIFVFMLINLGIGMLKTIYFTIFYVSLTRPEDIDKKYKDDLINYLNFKEVKPLK